MINIFTFPIEYIKHKYPRQAKKILNELAIMGEYNLVYLDYLWNELSAN